MPQKRKLIPYDIVYKTRTTPFFPACFIFVDYNFKKLVDSRLKLKHPILAAIHYNVVHWLFPRSLIKVGRSVLDRFFLYPRYLVRIIKKEREISQKLMREIKTPVKNLFQGRFLSQKGEKKILGIFHYYANHACQVDILGFLFQLYYAEIFKKKIFDGLKNYSLEEKESMFNFILSSPKKTNYEKFLFQLYHYLTHGEKTKDLHKITSRFYWLVHDYLGDIVDEKYIQRQVKEIKKGSLAKFRQELGDVNRRMGKIRRIRKIVPKAVCQKIDLAQGMLYLYNERKKELLNKVNIYLRRIVEHHFPSKELDDIHEIFQLLPEEVISLLKGQRVKDMKKRSKAWVYWMHNGEIGSGYFEYLKMITFFNEIKVLKGSPASAGITRGRVNIILNISHIQKFKEGSILVAPYTNVNYFPIMRKAKAILTETGGLTSHAAIVSRELKIPCIVGVKYLLSALKDGDQVEVDAERGIVKKI